MNETNIKKNTLPVDLRIVVSLAEKTPHHSTNKKVDILRMTLNGIWWWDSKFGDLESVEYSFIEIIRIW